MLTGTLASSGTDLRVSRRRTNTPVTPSATSATTISPTTSQMTGCPPPIALPATVGMLIADAPPASEMVYARGVVSFA